MHRTMIERPSPRRALVHAAAAALLGGFAPAAAFARDAPAAAAAQPEGPPVGPAELQRALRGGTPLPPLADVQRAAARRLLIDRARRVRWTRRARVAGLLPELTVAGDVQRDRGWDLDREPAQSDQLGLDEAVRTGARAQLRWQLDRLIFDPDELRAARAELDHGEAEVRLMGDVAALYGELVAVELELRLGRRWDIATGAALFGRRTELRGALLGITGMTEFSIDSDIFIDDTSIGPDIDAAHPSATPSQPQEPAPRGNAARGARAPTTDPFAATPRRSASRPPPPPPPPPRQPGG